MVQSAAAPQWIPWTISSLSPDCRKQGAEGDSMHNRLNEDSIRNIRDRRQPKRLCSRRAHRGGGNFSSNPDHRERVADGTTWTDQPNHHAHRHQSAGPRRQQCRQVGGRPAGSCNRASGGRPLLRQFGRTIDAGAGSKLLDGYQEQDPGEHGQENVKGRALHPQTGFGPD